MACSFEIGVHKSAMAMLIAVSVLGSTAKAVPASVYAIVVRPVALVLGFGLRSARRRVEPAAVPAPAAPDVLRPVA